MPSSPTGHLCRLAAAALACVLFFAVPAIALAGNGSVSIPHLAVNADTDTCAMCHRAHSAAGEIQWDSTHNTPSGSITTTHSALAVGSPAITGDSGLCFSCHGYGALGSGKDVQTAFSNESSHGLDPQVAPFGTVTRLECSSCHDSHGSARDASGNVYAALLRARDTTSEVYQGEQYCATCHKANRASSEFDGLAVYRTTPHYTGISPPQSNTKISCSVCHDPHGSPLPALLRQNMVPPSVPATFTVTGDDRTQCYACHSAADDTWPGASGYASTHATSPKNVAIEADWATKYGTASEVASRSVGECQNCHDPMGRSDGSGVALPKLVNREGSYLCYNCHTSSGPAVTDLKAIAYRHSRLDRQTVVSWSPDSRTAAYGRLAMWTADASTTPGAIIGPREFRPSSPPGALAVGDINGDGLDEMVVAERGAARLDVFVSDPFTGIRQSVAAGLSIAAPADYVAVGHFVNDGSGRAQIAVVDATAQTLRLYRLDGTTLTQIGGDLAVGKGASGVAVGDVVGTTSDDLVVTADSDDQFRVFSESGGALAANGPYATSPGPRGPSIGPVLDGSSANAIVIANGRATAGTGAISIFNGNGTKVTDLDTTPASLTPRATAVGDVLTGAPGAEIAVALDGAAGADGYVDVFSRPVGGGPYGAPQAVRLETDAHPTAVAVGDPDGNGKAEIVVANAGLWDPTAAGKDPFLEVLQADSASGSTIDAAASRRLGGGGRELAGGTPSLAIANLGMFGPSRHPMDVGGASHVSTEVATTDMPVPRHVVCTDCHNVHTATAQVATAPAVPGPLIGAWGVSVTNTSLTQISYTEQRGVAHEYQVCLKCHSGWSDLRGGRNVAFDFNPLNASFHAVESTPSKAAVPDGTWVSGKGLSNSTQLYCIDCHGDSVKTQAPGPHRSNDAPLLVAPLLGLSAADPSGFCYGCHLKSVYSDGAAPLSNFSDGTRSLHQLHVGTEGFTCMSCHDSHGSRDLPALLRPDIGFSQTGAPTPTGGACANSCHSSGASHAYAR